MSPYFRTSPRSPRLPLKTHSRTHTTYIHLTYPTLYSHTALPYEHPATYSLTSPKTAPTRTEHNKTYPLTSPTSPTSPTFPPIAPTSPPPTPSYATYTLISVPSAMLLRFTVTSVPYALHGTYSRPTRHLPTPTRTSCPVSTPSYVTYVAYYAYTAYAAPTP